MSILSPAQKSRIAKPIWHSWVLLSIYDETEISHAWKKKKKEWKREKVPLHVTTDVEMFLLFVWWFEDSRVAISPTKIPRLELHLLGALVFWSFNFVFVDLAEKIIFQDEEISGPSVNCACFLCFNAFDSEITGCTVNEKEDQSQWKQRQ